LVKAIDLPQPFAKLIYELGQAIESAQKTVHQAPAKVALHEAEIKCYIDCQQAFIEAEISLGSEAATKPVALQHAIEYENDPLEISAIGEDIAALSVLGDEVSMNEHESQPRQSTEKPSADGTKGTTSPADSNHDHQQGKGRAQAKRGAADMASGDVARVRHSHYPLCDRGPPYKHE